MEEYSAPIIYTSYEKWSEFCEDNIVPSAIKAKIKQFIDEDITSEQAKEISYLVIELMQMMEYRKECYELIDSRLRKRYNLQFPTSEINALMADKEIYSAAIVHFKKNKTSTKEELDRRIDYNCFGIRTPNETDTDEYKSKYLKRFSQFKKDNAEFTIPRK